MIITNEMILERENIKKMYNNQDIDSLISFLESHKEKYKSEKITDDSADELIAIREAMFSLAVGLAVVKQDDEYWQEEWNCYRDNNAQQMLSFYREIVDDYVMKCDKEKEAEIVKEKGKFDKLLNFVIHGYYSENKYENDSVRELRYEIETKLKECGFHGVKLDLLK